MEAAIISLKKNSDLLKTELEQQEEQFQDYQQLQIQILPK